MNYTLGYVRHDYAVMNFFETIHYKLLLVEGADGNSSVLQTYLAETGLELTVTVAQTGTQAIDLLASQQFNFMLLDYELRDMTAQNVLASARNKIKYEIPVVVVTGCTERNLDLELLESGATDFILREDCNPRILRKMILYCYVRLHHKRTFIQYKDALAELRQQKEVEKAILKDQKALRDANKRLSYIALHDPLTGLANRVLLLEHIERSVVFCQRNKTFSALLFIDLDRFKHVNDSLGHDAGDLLLVAVTERISNRLRATDLMARIGGDEFVVILDNLKRKENIIKLTDALLAELNQPFLLENDEVHISGSIGVNFFPKPGVDAETLIRQADQAMYQAKSSGKNSVRVYDEKCENQQQDKLQMENALRKGLSSGELFIVLQPRIDIQAWQVVGAEVLLRWRHPDKGLVPPSDFIPVAEESDLIVELGGWVLTQACKQIARWKQTEFAQLNLSVNVSSVQFRRRQVVEVCRDLCQCFDIDPKCLELEVTERTMVLDDKTTQMDFQAVREQGITISVDDFGTGYSSLSYLKDFPFDVVKIDGSFIQQIPDDKHSNALTATILHMSQQLDIIAVAECVETQEQLDFLLEHNCHQVQGYYFSKPVQIDEFEQWVQNFNQQPNLLTQDNTVVLFDASDGKSQLNRPGLN